MNIWFILGLALLAWSMYELVVGKTWILREINRKIEPVFYWVLQIIWFTLALWIVYHGITL